MERLILIDKPAGMTSFGVVARVRRVLSEQAGSKVKVGHTGTLDPFATGLLILLAGKLTKKSAEFLRLDKTYEAEIVLGKTSTTGDPEGEISEFFEETLEKYPNEEIPSQEVLQQTLQTFLGQIEQTPPAFSAVKVDGQRAYKLARAGKTPKIPKRQVTIYQLDLLEYKFPIVKIRVACSSGTYIRTLAEDIGQRLGTGAYCQALRRTKVGEYEVASATTLAALGVTS